MRVQFTDDELVEALSVIVNRIADSAGLSDRDRAMLKRWRSSKMKLGTDDMIDFVTKANDDFERAATTREKSPIRRPDWV
jgi:hypothetical protein